MWANLSTNFRQKGHLPSTSVGVGKLKTKVIAFPCDIKISAVCSFVSSHSTGVTETDRWTDRITIPKTTLAYMLCAVKVTGISCFDAWLSKIYIIRNRIYISLTDSCAQRSAVNPRIQNMMQICIRYPYIFVTVVCLIKPQNLLRFHSVLLMLYLVEF